MHLSRKTTAIISAMIGNSIFGFSFLASKVALEHVSPLVLLASRFLFSFLLLNLLLLLRLASINVKGKNLRPLIYLGICQPVIYFICENFGLQLTSSSFSGIMIALVPIFSFLFASVLLKETFTLSKVLWSFCSLSGIIVISLFENRQGSITLLGALLLLLAVFSAAFYNILSRKTASSFTSFERTYFMFATGSIVFLFIALIHTKGQYFNIIHTQITNVSFLLPLLYLSVFSSVIAFFCLNFAVSYLPVQQATSYTNLATVVSIFAGVVFLHENFTVLHFIGSFLILFGIYKVNKPQKGVTS